RLVAEPKPLLLIGRDAHHPAGGDVVDAVEVVDLESALELGITCGAALGLGGSAEMTIPALGAEAAGAHGELGVDTDAFLVAHAEDRFDHPVLAALVVDDRARTELGQRQKARARQEAV